MTETEWPYRAGQILDAAELADGDNTYTPEITSNGNPMDLGTGPTQDGFWYRTLDRWVIVWLRIRWGTGVGIVLLDTVHITLPTAASTVLNASTTIGLADQLGDAQLRDDSASAFRIARASLASHDGGTGGLAQIRLTVPSGGYVTGTSPWSWDDSDAIAAYVEYLSA